MKTAKRRVVSSQLVSCPAHVTIDRKWTMPERKNLSLILFILLSCNFFPPCWPNIFTQVSAVIVEKLPFSRVDLPESNRGQLSQLHEDPACRSLAKRALLETIDWEIRIYFEWVLVGFSRGSAYCIGLEGNLSLASATVKGACRRVHFPRIGKKAATPKTRGISFFACDRLTWSALFCCLVVFKRENYADAIYHSIWALCVAPLYLARRFVHHNPLLQKWR